MDVAWLHLSDLHVSERALPPYINDRFKQDLAMVHKLAGPFQFVLFTGDLVQRGTAAEFQHLTRWLDKLFNHLETLGPKPTLLAVPGNHDLMRPALDPAVRCLLDWKNDREVQADFWSSTTSRSDPYRQVIERAFQPYQDWLSGWYERHPPSPGVELHRRGLLPGDMSASITHEGHRVGVVGLNSSFLHLADVERGALALGPLQLEQACNGDPSEWCAKNHLNLLATHHPHTWFDNPSRFEVEVYDTGWFAAHLFGHMHEPLSLAQQVSGGSARRYFQAPSLFGIEETRAGTKRIFGYAAKRLQFDRERTAMRIWPRVAKIQGNEYGFIPDFTFRLEQTDPFPNSFAMDLAGGIRRPVPVPVPVPVVARPTAAAPPQAQPQQHGANTAAPAAVARRPIPLPWAAYSRATYVERGVETFALNSVQPGSTLIISGPPACGKSMLLSYLAEALREGAPPTRVLRLGLGRLTQAELEDPPAAFKQLLAQVVEACRTDGQSSAALQKELTELAEMPLSPELALTQVFADHLLKGEHERVVLVLDQWEKVNNHALAAPLVQMLRPWVQDHQPGSPWARFRLVMGATGSSLYFDRVTVVSEFFNVTNKIRLGHLTPLQSKELAAMHGVDWRDDELYTLHEDLLRGQPFLTRHVFFLRATGLPIQELLDRRSLRELHCDGQLQQLWLNMKGESDVFDAFSTVVNEPDVKLDSGVAAKLRSAGLVELAADGKLRPATPLLADYFRERR